MPKSVFSDAHKIVVETLVSARKEAGLRQIELAERIGKDQTYISRIEQGQRRVDVLEFYRLAEAMGCDPIELYGRLVAKLPARFII
jgi:transcriptional regulator with XRE-family HTH domain